MTIYDKSTLTQDLQSIGLNASAIAAVEATLGGKTSGITVNNATNQTVVYAPPSATDLTIVSNQANSDAVASAGASALTNASLQTQIGNDGKGDTTTVVLTDNKVINLNGSVLPSNYNIIGTGNFFQAVYGENATNVTMSAGDGQSTFYGSDAGNSVLNGSTSATGAAYLSSGHGATSHATITGGLGTDTLVANGGTDLLTSGQGANQTLISYGAANDTMTASADNLGGLKFVLGSTHSTVDLTQASVGNDSVFTGNGSDSISTGAHGSFLDLGALGTLGHATVLGGTGADTISVEHGAAAMYDSINGGGGSDVVTFKGYSAGQFTANTDNNGVTHISFTSGQSADVSNVTSIFIGGKDILHPNT